MPKALLIIAPSNFRDEELFDTKSALEEAGVDAIVASKTRNEATGMLGRKIKPDLTLSDVIVDSYDAIIFVGGSGSSVYFDDPDAHKLAQDAYNKNKIVAAICIAPSTLANAGILRDKKATSYASEASNLRIKGADYTGSHVETDGKIITADGPVSAKEFGKTIANALK